MDKKTDFFFKTPIMCIWISSFARNLSKSFKIFENLTKSFEIFRNLSKSFKIFQNISKSFKIFQNLSESSRIRVTFRDVLESLGFTEIALSWYESFGLFRNVNIIFGIFLNLSGSWESLECCIVYILQTNIRVKNEFFP